MGGWVEPRGWPGRPGVELERPKFGDNHLHIPRISLFVSYLGIQRCVPNYIS
jgi:hypothetical protein